MSITLAALPASSGCLAISSARKHEQWVEVLLVHSDAGSACSALLDSMQFEPSETSVDCGCAMQQGVSTQECLMTKEGTNLIKTILY